MRILIAEDDAHLRRGLADLLGREGYDCLTAADGRSALAFFNSAAPDFCILDVMLPKLDGFAVCTRIREQDSRVPILLLTARGQENDRVRGFECGADDYVPKPFGTRELVVRIKAIARRAAPRAPEAREPFSLGDLAIDPRALRAFRQGAAIELTRREVDLLVLLHARTGLAVSRDELLDRCWGRDYMPNSRSLDQFVFALRRKIERDPSEPRIICTVHGVGYRYDSS